ncbi:MAG: polymer-forming cytoskeletal protein [Candidatus Hydrogenedentes bacterium]|nr:polymer-forming cytoskeletal protein [Candidatus Hydrogenedentota bacterium]
MLEARQKRSVGDARVVTIIGQGTTIIGDIKSKGSVRIEGVVSGKVHSDESITVHETGRVKADLVSGTISISGEVEGNVTASERLDIVSPGKLVGDITAPRVAIAEGVLFEGKCVMKAVGTDPALAAPPEQQALPNPDLQRRPV